MNQNFSYLQVDKLSNIGYRLRKTWSSRLRIDKDKLRIHEIDNNLIGGEMGLSQ